MAAVIMLRRGGGARPCVSTAIVPIAYGAPSICEEAALRVPHAGHFYDKACRIGPRCRANASNRQQG